MHQWFLVQEMIYTVIERKELRLRVFQATCQVHDYGWVIATNLGVKIFKDPRLKSVSFAAALKQTKV